eukprot:1670788-Prymnesium_polylepis.1
MFEVLLVVGESHAILGVGAACEGRVCLADGSVCVKLHEGTPQANDALSLVDLHVIDAHHVDLKRAAVPAGRKVALLRDDPPERCAVKVQIARATVE